LCDEGDCTRRHDEFWSEMSASGRINGLGDVAGSQGAATEVDLREAASLFSRTIKEAR
jgi:hypothetical protein